MIPIINLVRELLIRIKLKSPKLFIQIQWWSGAIGTIITATLLLNSTFDWEFELIGILNIPFTTILSGIVTFLGGLFVTANLTVQDTKRLETKLDEKRNV